MEVQPGTEDEFLKCPLKNLSDQFLKAKSSFFMMTVQDSNTPA